MNMMMHEIFLSPNVLMQFISIAGCQGVRIKIIDLTISCSISLWEDEVLKLIQQIKQLDDINIQHPKNYSNLFCNAFYIKRQLHTSKLSIVTTTTTTTTTTMPMKKYAESIMLDDLALSHLCTMETELRNVANLFDI